MAAVPQTLLTEGSPAIADRSAVYAQGDDKHTRSAEMRSRCSDRAAYGTDSVLKLLPAKTILALPPEFDSLHGVGAYHGFPMCVCDPRERAGMPQERRACSRMTIECLSCPADAGRKTRQISTGSVPVKDSGQHNCNQFNLELLSTQKCTYSGRAETKVRTIWFSCRHQPQKTYSPE